ncbi:hypothetical protein ANN_15439 [Periplaneta americana]|uniref:Uncharacterized protein n=1 Tax=Periplaneta americana TaxID=6978 RepID=A0ABQ8SGD8_PERAM|nr:hypothetical protein ANN_15439 [Periplaneta americana]
MRIQRKFSERYWGERQQQRIRKEINQSRFDAYPENIRYNLIVAGPRGFGETIDLLTALDGSDATHYECSGQADYEHGSVFQQLGAPPHYCGAVRGFLNANFHNSLDEGNNGNKKLYRLPGKSHNSDAVAKRRNTALQTRVRASIRRKVGDALL